MWHAIVRQHERYAQWRGSVPSQIQYFLDSASLTMYEFTIAGGAIWGLCRGIHTGLKGGAMIKAIGRTAFITGLAPALFVGLIAGSFVHFRKEAKSKESVQMFSAGTSYLAGTALVVMHSYMSHVSPYWLGGHLLGFMLFFASESGRISIGDNLDALKSGKGGNSPGIIFDIYSYSDLVLH